MNAYRYNSATGEYEGVVRRQPSPLEPGKFLLPAKSTEKAPPPAKKNQAAVWDNQKWNLVPDYRAAEYWDKTTAGRVRLPLGEEPGDEATAVNPAGVLRPEWDGEKWVEGEEPPEEKEARAQAAILAKLPEILEQNGSAAVKAAIAAVRGEEEARRG